MNCQACHGEGFVCPTCQHDDLACACGSTEDLDRCMYCDGSGSIHWVSADELQAGEDNRRSAKEYGSQYVLCASFSLVLIASLLLFNSHAGKDSWTFEALRYIEKISRVAKRKGRRCDLLRMKKFTKFPHISISFVSNHLSKIVT